MCNINNGEGCKKQPCGCGGQNQTPIQPRNTQTLAIMSIPVQYADFENIYCDDKALSVGTIFPELDLPYMQTRRAKP